MPTWLLALLCVVSIVMIAIAAAVMIVPQRLSHRKPLETDLHDIVDPLPVSVAHKK